MTNYVCNIMLHAFLTKHGNTSCGFFVNAVIVNAFILYQKVSTRSTEKKRNAHIDFHWEVETHLMAGFSSQKWKFASAIHVGPTAPPNEANHESVHMGTKISKRCKWHYMQGRVSLCLSLSKLGQKLSLLYLIFILNNFDKFQIFSRQICIAYQNLIYPLLAQTSTLWDPVAAT